MQSQMADFAPPGAATWSTRPNYRHLINDWSRQLHGELDKTYMSSLTVGLFN